ncbi:FAD/NAD(P)-binding protein [Paraburkholderia sp. CNPSo 3281]|uniref:FAD/NAD(P)-binding protein n=1 Tax=Paraburkholderia sp. CNPSo 3281 TaxID=2940933 RepID=UPI0020B693FC|nr:FAD/NAD(P)-binding domain-containing protein [Paraburkholderia sp. CNPSo 3281]MCP3717389.1 FAD/NAD(P)-binding protein [Paraburkholderia sp. CNPSo 3281]
MMQKVVTIIGMGPRGVSVLERIGHYARSQPLPLKLIVNVVDPGECGQGTHTARQPHYLLTNTLANQVTIFPPHSRAIDGEGPSFGDWARQQGYRKFGSACHATGGAGGEEIDEQSYLPRQLLGLYFTWAYDRIARMLPANVELRHWRRRAVGVRELAGERYAVMLEGACVLDSDFVLLTTGHGKRLPDAHDERFEAFVRSASVRNGRLAFFAHAYPVDQLEAVSPDAAVAIQGFGLTAHDVLCQLTTGRGGRFVRADGRLGYEPSGREPRILMYSRKSLPFSGRPVNQKSVGGRYVARFFTVEAIEKLRIQARATRGSPQIDFVNEVLPLVKADMAYARRLALDGVTSLDTGWVPDEAELVVIDTILDPLAGRSFTSMAEFEVYFREFLLDDLREIDKGNVHGPVKAATDVLRDLRDHFRLAAEYAGFTPESHAVFVGEFVPTLNRIVFGPPRHRNDELLALLDAGIVELAGGPAAHTGVDEARAQFVIETSFAGGVERRHADVLALSRIDVYSPLNDAAPLTADMIQRGVIRPHMNGDYHPGGIDIDTNNNVLGADGRAQSNMWAIGYLVEGPHYYTQELPRPGRLSRLTLDAQQCVEALFTSLAAAARGGDVDSEAALEDPQLIGVAS